MRVAARDDRAGVLERLALAVEPLRVAGGAAQRHDGMQVGAPGEGLDAQRERLEAAGAVVVRGNARAAALAKEAAGG